MSSLNHQLEFDANHENLMLHRRKSPQNHLTSGCEGSGLLSD
jgi:hypothetical protein